MLERRDIERYERNARRILEALDCSRVPINWAAIDEPELIRVISQELIRIDREWTGNKNALGSGEFPQGKEQHSLSIEHIGRKIND